MNGISIFPHNCSQKEVFSYIDLASKNKVSYIFTSLFAALNKISDNPDSVADFKSLISYANSKNMKVIADVSTFVFDKLKISPYDLEYFVNLGLYGIRLDTAMDGIYEAVISNNDLGLKIFLNASTNYEYLANVVSYGANLNNLGVWHNYYPQEHTGIALEKFVSMNQKITNLGIKNIYTFVTSSSISDIGSWIYHQKSPTIEIHRNLNLELQIRHSFALKNISGLFLSLQTKNEDDLKLLSLIPSSKVSIFVEPTKDCSINEKLILNSSNFYSRIDTSDLIIRTGIIASKYATKKLSIPYKTNNSSQKNYELGDILILNDDYDRYSCELQIVRKPFPVDKKRNLVAKIPSNELIMLDCIKDWTHFKFLIK